MTFSYATDLALAARVLSSLSAVEDHLDEVVPDLRWRIARLHETWQGHAATAHVDAHQAWEASYAEMREALSAMRAAVGTARSCYASAAEENTAMWGAVRCS
jgi:ESAT-6 family protein